MERREKIEQACKERERTRLECIQKKWTRREENEFLRVLTGYGVDLQPHSSTPMPDWARFKAMSKLDKKSDEALSDYYKVFIAMCKRLAGVQQTEEEKSLEGLIEDISEDHARLVLDRLELLSKLKEVAKHPSIDEHMPLCQNNYDTPDWWEPGKHDRELVKAVLKHGLYNSGEIIYNNPEYSFFKAMRAHATTLEEKYLTSKMAAAATAENEAKELATPKKEESDADAAAVVENQSPKEDANVKSSASGDEIPSCDKDVATLDVTDKATIKEEPTAEENTQVEVKSEPKAEEVADEKIDADAASEQPAEKETETVAVLSPKPESTVAETTVADDEEKPVETPVETSVDATNKEEDTIVKSDAQKSEEPMEGVETQSVTDETPADAEVPADATAEPTEGSEAEKPASPKPEEMVTDVEEAITNEPVVPEPKCGDELAAEPEPLKESNGMEVDEEKSEDIEPAVEEETKEASSSKEAETSAEEKEHKSIADDETEIAAETESVEATESDKADDIETTETVESEEPASEKEESMEAAVEKSDEEEGESKEVAVPEKSVESETESSPSRPSTPIKDSEEERAEKDKEIAKTEETPVVEERVKSPVPGASAPNSPAKLLEEEDDDVMIVGKGDPDDDEVMNEKEIAVEEECKKQAAELKARFPDLEVIQPLVKVKANDELVLAEMRERFMSTYDCPMQVYWFRDFALEKRISHIIFCIEHAEWPVNKTFSAYTGCQGVNLDIPLYETVKHLGSPQMDVFGRRSSTPDVITITTDQNLAKQLQNQLPSATTLSQISVPTSTGKKRKRHIAIDVETERAKLHALLNSSQGPMTPQGAGQPPTTPQQKSANWPEDEPVPETPPMRRTNAQSSLQPPPAHQHHPISRSSNNQQQASNYSTKPTVIPGTSSTLTPIDLSSRFNICSAYSNAKFSIQSDTNGDNSLSNFSLPKMNMADMLKGPIDLSEAQDFSMTKKSNLHSVSSVAAAFGGKGKLDDMLTKLMKKNNTMVSSIFHTYSWKHFPFTVSLNTFHGYSSY